MDDDVRAYIDGIAAEHRPLFDRVHGLILEAHPEAVVTIAYTIPTYRAGRRRLHVGTWRHGLSIYGWPADRDAGFAARHPELLSGKRTLRVRPRDAAALSDDELRSFLAAALAD
jgi:uncharacterized protein YdhG (YjbR/CyaY superfamily)